MWWMSEELSLRMSWSALEENTEEKGLLMALRRLRSNGEFIQTRIHRMNFNTGLYISLLCYRTKKTIRIIVFHSHFSLSILYGKVDAWFDPNAQFVFLKHTQKIVQSRICIMYVFISNRWKLKIKIMENTEIRLCAKCIYTSIYIKCNNFSVQS